MSKYCECCEYTTNLSANLKKHLATNKHKLFFKTLNKVVTEPPNQTLSHNCKYCQGSFSSRSALSYHVNNTCKKHKHPDKELDKLIQETYKSLETIEKSDKERKSHGDNVDFLINFVEMNMLNTSPINTVRTIQDPNTSDSKQTTEKHKKPKKRAIPSTVKKMVWNSNIGEEVGKSKCYCCKSTDITQMSFHCGHIKPEAKGGEAIVSNLKPICQNCNSSMGTKDMDEFMKSLV
jgi:5-methylcytosine-specific restriction endonuclease McrA